MGKPVDKSVENRQLVTQAEYARLRGLNRSTVCRAVQRGMIPTHGKRKLLDVAEADQARAENLDPAQVTAGNAKPPPPAEKGGKAKPASKGKAAGNGKTRPKTPPPEDLEDEDEDKAPPAANGAAEPVSFMGMTYSEARARREVLKFQREELELEKARAEVVSRAKAKRLIQEAAQAASKAWTQWPARVYAEMAAELGVDGAKLHQVLDDHVRRQLEQVSHAPPEFKE